MDKPIYSYYLKLLENDSRPEFLEKYLKTPSLLRLQKVAYFCGMDKASKDIYDFKENYSRFDHSLSVALLTWKYSHNKKATLAGLFHDVGTPCFSHVIDYMNKDYATQESTEAFTERILKNDSYLQNCLREDNIRIDEIINFKKYSIVDNSRPKLCADRLDGVILTGISWTKDINSLDINRVIEDITVFHNEENEEELGFQSETIANQVVEFSKKIDIYCHSSEDNYMMELLADITRKAISCQLFTYEELYTLQEDEVWSRLMSCNNAELARKLYEFESIQKSQIEELSLSNVKVRDLNPLVGGRRIKEWKE